MVGWIMSEDFSAIDIRGAAYERIFMGVSSASLPVNMNR